MIHIQRRSARWSLATGFVLATVCGASTVHADPISLVNGGFETPDGANIDIIGWEEVEFGGDTWRAGTYTYSAAPETAFTGPNPEGDRVGYLNATSTISQGSSHALLAGEVYTLSTWVGDRDQVGYTQRSVTLAIYADNGSGGLGDALVSEVVVGTGEVPTGGWAQFSVMFDTNDPGNAGLVAANVGRDLHVFIGHSLGETGGGDAAFDDVQFSYTPVPEPASLALVGLGLLALVRRRHR